MKIHIALFLFAGFSVIAAPPTYRIYATREGLQGGTTANGHVISYHDHFCALPSRTVLNANGGYTYTVNIRNVSNGRVANNVPVWDVGPWNTHDNYWHAPREMFNDLAKGTPEAYAAYYNGYNGGRDEFGRIVGLPNGIDLADGTFWDDLGMVDNGWVDVTFNFEGNRPAGRNDVYVQATDNQIWGRSWVSSQGWYAWGPVGGSTSYGPSATSWGINDINVFIKGTDNQIWVDTWVGSWGGFYSIGGNPVGSPASCSQGVGNLEVFWRGTDNALWHKSYNNSWGAAENLGGGLTSDPCAVSWGAGRVDVFVRGGDNACWQRTWTSSSGWSGWYSLGGYLSGKVAAASWGSGRLDLFCRSSDNQLYHKGWQGSWYPSNTGWEALGGNCTSDPGACSYANGQIDVYVRGTDYGLWHKWFDGQTWTWSGFESLGGDFHNSPAVCSYNHAQ